MLFKEILYVISIPNWRRKIRASTSATFIYLTAPRAVLHAPTEPIQLGHDDGVNFLAVPHGEEPYHAGAHEELKRIAGGGDQPALRLYVSRPILNSLPAAQPDPSGTPLPGCRRFCSILNKRAPANCYPSTHHPDGSWDRGPVRR